MRIEAIRPDVELPEDREPDCDPARDGITVDRLLVLDDGVVVCVLSACPPDEETLVFTVETKRLRPVPGLKDLDAAWTAGNRLLVLADGTLSLVDLKGDARALLDMPEDVQSVDAAWLADGPRVAGIARGERREGPGLFPSDRDRDRLVAWSPADGWRDVAEIPSGCRSLSLSGDGRRCAWLAPVSVIPEEAMRGEYAACDLESGEVKALTKGAGKAWGVQMAPDGSGAVYEANFQQKRPITTHTPLWWHAWESDAPVRLTEPGRCVDSYGWLAPDRLWVTYVDGVDRVTEAVSLNGDGEPMDAVLNGSGVGTKGVIAGESGDRDRMPFLAFGNDAVEIPQPDDFSDLRTRVVDWEAPDGLPIRGVVYEAEDTPDGAALIVRAHGGPAGDVTADRGGAIRHRHLLRAGYRILEPAFRGSLGFGDDFLGANIACQGVKDLEDIVSGVDHLVEAGTADRDRVGIFGGSYGGYMTLRAVAVTDRFKTGVALYGFIDNRWMTLETGDFTYEDEYIAPVTWPLREDAIKSDVFSRMHEIDCPLLLLHGDQDPICTLSQSKIVYRALEHRGVTAGLVVYPGEGHGFRKTEHRRDCARRTLAWFLQFLPV